MPAKKASGGKPESIRLNKYIAASGLCSRRAADALIEAGKVRVNGKVVRQLGTRIVPGRDVVEVGRRRIEPREEKIYILLNKPKDVVTTRRDERGRKTVMDLLPPELREVVFPVGRLDRATTGVLLLTNDGTLAHALTHPSAAVEKIYRVVLDRPLLRRDLHRLVEGVELDDGPMAFDEAAWVSDDRTEVGVRLHSGRNRIIRRVFEALGYTVRRLDRTVFAGLTKKGLARGRWRRLSPKEVRNLYRRLPKASRGEGPQ